MTVRLLSGILLALLCMQPAVYAADNPFLSDRNGQETEQTKERPHLRFGGNRFFVRQFRKIVAAQRYLYERLSEGIRTVKDGGNPVAWLVLVSAVFAYGILHALGPGHGKVFIVSYFLSRRAPLLKGFLFSVTVAFLHAGISTAAVLLVYRVIERGLMHTLDDAQRYMMMLSYTLIICAGIYLLVHAIMHHKDVHVHGSDSKSFDGRHFFSMAFSIALTPCPATILVLLFSLSNGVVIPGLVAVLFLAAGMGLSLGVVALLTLGTSSTSVMLLERYAGIGQRVLRVLAILGPAAIIIIGTVMLSAELV
ncbi:MAG: nickel/cobalt transporter [Spirochaetota bacterium]